MAQVPQTFSQLPPSAIASYDYTDIAENTGIVKFYLYSSETSAGTTYHLSTNDVYSDDINRQFATASDEDFDLSQFSLPKTIKGTGIANIAYRIDGASGSAYIICRVRKWDGSSETTLVSVQSPTIAIGNQGVWNFPLVIPQTHFKKGDILRFTIEGYQNGAGVAEIGIDPKNREVSGGQTITQSSIYIPFRLDI